MTISYRAAALAAALIALAPAGRAASPAPALTGQLPASAYATPGRLVPLPDGRRLNLFCVGSGEPTVVFISGLGDNDMDWGFVQGQVGRLTRSCSYDRAGLGFSDASRNPGDAAHAMADLHDLLAAAHVGGKVVPVGHSLGGLFATYYAATYRAEVAGLVLVDSSFAHQYEQLTASFTPTQLAAYQQAAVAGRKHFHQCLGLAERGALRLPYVAAPSADALCLDDPSQAPARLRLLDRVRDGQFLRASVWAETLSELANLRDEVAGQPNPDDREIDAANLAFGALPIVALTAGNGVDPAGLRPECQALGLTAAQCAAFGQAWLAGHARLAQLSSRGQSILVPGASHYIQLEAPATVIAAVQTVVGEARQ